MKAQTGNRNTDNQTRKQGHLAVVVPALLCLFIFTGIMVSGCDQAPRDIRVGEQECDHCRMMISEEQFAAQVITKQGRQYVFDAIECMAAFETGDAARELDIHGLWVPDFNNPGTWIPAAEAVYLQSDNLRSPMALNISAYSDQQAARVQKDEFSGRMLTWDQVQELVQDAWSGGSRQQQRQSE